jgi:cobalt-zinc-cadmium efflux system membrane fusion protein
MMKTILISIAILTLVSCGSKKTNDSKISEFNDSKTIESLNQESLNNIEVDAITSATRTDNRPVFNGVIVIPPQRHATITLFMDGVVKNTTLLSGMFVRKGELLAVLENPEYITLQQSYIESRVQEEFLEAEFRRQEMLFGSEAASQKTYQQSKAEYLSMKSRREAAAAQLRLLGFDPAKILADGIIPQLELRSPIDGYVANMQTNIGKYIAAGETICDVIDKNTTLLKLTIYEKDIDEIKIGDKIIFRVNGLGAQTFDATVISLGQTVDIVTRSLEVFARVEGVNAQFRPGMYVSAQVAER